MAQDSVTKLPPPVTEKPQEWLTLADSFNSALAELGTTYLDEAKKIDRKYIDMSEQALQSLMHSLESARKTAMNEDKLDKAIEFDELKTKFATWSSWNASPAPQPNTKKDRKKEHPLILEFQKSIESISADRLLSVQTLDKQFLSKANTKRNEFLDAFETFRLKAMKADDLPQAKLIREEIKRIKEMEISVPSVDESELSDEVPVQDTSKSKQVMKSITVIKPIGQGSGQFTIKIPDDVVKIEVAFISSDSQPEQARLSFHVAQIDEKLGLQQ
jgi:hypothetical protein